MSRLPDWEDRLHAFIAANMARPFQWGEWDCALFATACAAELTGEDRAAAFRGAYDTREGAALALREIGKGTLIKTLDSLFPRKPFGLAVRGDLVMAATAVGVCDGAWAWFVGETEQGEGLVRIPRREWVRAWGV